MTIRGPFGAETPDEVLIAYVNGRLTPDEHAEVDRWLDEHPEWRARLGSYAAIGRAVREGAPSSASTDAPDIGALDGLWAAIDAESQRDASTSLPPPTLAAPITPPPPPTALDSSVVSLSSRRRGPRWALAAAAAAVLVVGGAIVATRGDDGDTDSADAPVDEVRPSDDLDDVDNEAEPTGEAPGADEGETDGAPGDAGGADSDDGVDGEARDDGGTSSAGPLPPSQALPDPEPGDLVPTDEQPGVPVPGDPPTQQLRMGEIIDAVERTTASGSARVAGLSIVTVETDGGEANVYGEANGVVDFAAGSAVDVELDNPDGALWPDGSVSSDVVHLVDGSSYVRCADDFVAGDPDESGCALGDDIAPFNLIDVLALLAAGEGEVVRRGPDPDGLMGYLVKADVPIDAELRPVEIHVYVDPADGLIRFVRVYTPSNAVVPVTIGGATGEPTVYASTMLWWNVALTDHGEPVELPAVD